MKINSLKSTQLIPLLCMLGINAQAATFALSVNLSDSLRPVTHAASGSLYGMTESLPSDIANLVAPLKPNVFTQPALSGTGHQQGVAAAAIPVSARLASTTGKVQIRLADVLPGWPYTWPGQVAWLSSVTTVIKSKIASGRTNYDGYEIWNEPDGTWKSSNGDFYTVCWKPTYDLIRSLDPTAKIIGPSYSYYNSNNMKAFLTYGKNNNCLPDVVSWHQWGSGGFSSTFDSYRALETSLNISPRAISINEYSSSTHTYEGSPGVSVPFIAKFERKKVESACISWWFTGLPGRLGSLLTSSNQKGGGWWLYKWYGDMTGKMVKVTPPNDNSEGVDGFASIDLSTKYASIILGGNSIGTVNVNISGIPASFGSSVSVKLEYVTWTDKDTPVTATTTISTASYTITNGAITVPVNVTNQFYGYRIYLTPEQGKTPPSIQFAIPSKDTSLVAPTTLTFKAIASDADGTISKVDFYNGNTLLQSKTAAPYTYEWTNVPVGKYTIRAVATDNDGNTSQDTVAVTATVAQAAFGGTSWQIPGTIQLEKYDVGGEGFAYHDADTVNSGNMYRNDGVDITGDSTTGFKIGWTIAGEWLEYTVNNSSSATYQWEIRASMSGDSAAFQLFVDSSAITDTITIPSTGSWDTYSTLSGTLKSAMPAGNHILRVVLIRSYANIDWLSFSTGPTTITPPNLKPSNMTGYQLYDLHGNHLGEINAVDKNNLHNSVRAAFPQIGRYIAKPNLSY